MHINKILDIVGCFTAFSSHCNAIWVFISNDPLSLSSNRSFTQLLIDFHNLGVVRSKLLSCSLNKLVLPFISYLE